MSLDTRSALQAWPSTECVRTREEQDERLQGLNEEARIGRLRNLRCPVLTTCLWLCTVCDVLCVSKPALSDAWY
eukprot:1992480-Rhodomonas_salina.2